MNKLTRLILAAVAGLTALALLLVKTDREFINLTPSPSGPENSIVLENRHTYAQIFPATRTSVSRIGLYLRPTVNHLPVSSVTVQLLTNGELRAAQQISTAAIDSEGVSQVRFTEAIPVTINTPLTIALSVPSELSGQIRALLRQPDDTFNNENAKFTVDEKLQGAPLAYQVYYLYQPPLAWQLSGLLFLVAAVILIPRRRRSLSWFALTGLGLAILYAMPALLLGSLPLLLIIFTALAFTIMASLLARLQLGLPAVLTGAAIFAFTTWWALHFANDWNWAPKIIGQVASLKDIFLDPRQIPTANGGNWKHYGSYIGVIGAVMAFLGLTATVGEKKYLPHIAVTLLSLFVTAVSPDAIIVTTLGLAFFAAHGLEAVRMFLGKDRLVTALCYVISVLVLLDLFHVGARTLEFSVL